MNENEERLEFPLFKPFENVQAGIDSFSELVNRIPKKDRADFAIWVGCLVTTINRDLVEINVSSLYTDAEVGQVVLMLEDTFENLEFNIKYFSENLADRRDDKLVNFIECTLKTITDDVECISFFSRFLLNQFGGQDE
ncbi:MAG: hypothetical protein H7A25_22350 [Leptospiraceae bacterium]|nr:hypothetical protein [Leptospiraceae bacterium]MCP5502656.1 hypothetical protein [Leptospiraceae bacterium]